MSVLRKLRLTAVATLTLLALAPASSEALEGPPDQVGQWSPLISWGVQAKHMTLLDTGKVLVWSQGDQARVWDPATGSMTPVPAPFGDVHCAGQVTLADGRVLVIGGQNVNIHVGIPVTSIFDPRTGSWSRGTDMAFARWYPTVTTMADGRALVTSGDQSSSATRVDVPEIYDPATDTWTKGSPRAQDLYPFMYQLANGKVYEAGTRNTTAYFDAFGAMTWTAGPTAPFRTNAYSESGAMYGAGKILRAGGGDPAKDQTAVIDMNSANPQWRLTASMNHPRRRMNTPILLDGSVMAIGGATTSDDLTGAVYAGEIWDPATEQWREVAAMTKSRMYHSTALTLPDGRVVVGGGEIGMQGAPEDSPTPGVQTDAQIYSPPYLFQPNRPAITSSPASSGYGQALSIGTTTTDVAKVALMRPSAVTHAIDMNQRYVPLPFTTSGTQVTAQSPATPYEAPPGEYMLVVVDSRGVPSVAKWVMLGSGAPVQDAGPVKLPTATTPTAPPVPGFVAQTPTSGAAPLTVRFGNQTGGQPDSFAWDFNGDGKVDSGAANPVFTYTSPGTYTVKLTARNAKGAAEAVKTGYITVTGGAVTPPPDTTTPPAGSAPGAAPGPGTPGGSGGHGASGSGQGTGSSFSGSSSESRRRTFVAVADATISSQDSQATAGAEPDLAVRQGSGPAAANRQALVKFDVSGLGGAAASAKLRLFTTDPSSDGGSAFPVSSAWTEPGVSWTTSPAITGASVASAGATTKGRWVELDVTRAVRGDGVVSFALRSTSANAAGYASRETGDRAPQLVVMAGATAASAAPVADFSTAPRSGTGPLTVAFTDESAGATSWSWDFQGDGSVDSTQRNPRFTYARPGTYTVKLLVKGAGGTDTRTLQGAVVVGAKGPARLTRSFAPVADATVTSTSPRAHAGRVRTLALRQGDKASGRTVRSYLKFRLAGLKGVPASAKLRLWVTGAGSDGGSVHPVTSRWTEGGLAWSGAPGLTISSLGSAGATAKGTWVEWDVTAGVAGNGLVSFALASTSADAASYASREDAARRPQLVVTQGRGTSARQASIRRAHLASLLAPRPSLVCPLDHGDL
jgi:PKD repeat protein